MSKTGENGGVGSGAGTSALAWALAGCGAGMALSRFFFAGLADARWLVPSGAILVVGGIALGFYGYVLRGGLDSHTDGDGDATASDPHRSEASFLAPLAGVVTISFVVAIAAALHSRAPATVGAAAEGTPSVVTVPGLELTLPPARDLQENRHLSRVTAELVAPPGAQLKVEWHPSEVEADEAALRKAAETMTTTWGDLKRSYAYDGPSTRGAVFTYQKNKRHTALALVRCIDQKLSLSIAVTADSESDAAAAARTVADGARCTEDAAAREAADIWPTVALDDQFGLIDLKDGARMFASLDGEAIVFHRHAIGAVKTLQREHQALQLSLSGGGTVENWAAASWPIGHRTPQPLWSFDLVEASGTAREVRKQAYATTLLCHEPGVGFVVLALADDRSKNLVRLLSVSCPRKGEATAQYKTIEEVARRACDQGDATACDALGKAQ